MSVSSEEGRKSLNQAILTCFQSSFQSFRFPPSGSSPLIGYIAKSSKQDMLEPVMERRQSLIQRSSSTCTTVYERQGESSTSRLSLSNAETHQSKSKDQNHQKKTDDHDATCHADAELAIIAANDLGLEPTGLPTVQPPNDPIAKPMDETTTPPPFSKARRWFLLLVFSLAAVRRIQSLRRPK